jgi:hypothetical protein
VSIQSIFFKNNLYLFFSRLSQSKRMLFNKWIRPNILAPMIWQI